MCDGRGFPFGWGQASKVTKEEGKEGRPQRRFDDVVQDNMQRDGVTEEHAGIGEDGGRWSTATTPGVITGFQFIKIKIPPVRYSEPSNSF